LEEIVREIQNTIKAVIRQRKRKSSASISSVATAAVFSRRVGFNCERGRRRIWNQIRVWLYPWYVVNIYFMYRRVFFFF